MIMCGSLYDNEIEDHMPDNEIEDHMPPLQEMAATSGADVQGFAPTLPHAGFATAFAAAPALSDAARKQRGEQAAEASSSGRSSVDGDAAAAPPAPPQFGPLVPNLNKPANGADAPGGQAWLAGDRRRLGGFDARFHSANPCALTARLVCDRLSVSIARRRICAP